jgi:CobQ-like glutamine amidotransferase family enzyme
MACRDRTEVVSSDLIIVPLYPDMLRTYGDRGNVLTLQRRAEWRGFTVDVIPVSVGEPIPSNARLIVIGGGTDRIQKTVGPDLRGRGSELREAAANGALVLGVCGGYQLLGRAYVLADGTKIEGPGLLDMTTYTGDDRIVGRVRARADLWGREFQLAGFENHSGRTLLGPRARALGQVEMGQGNNGRDGGEGAVQGTVVGTYLHGPLLPSNASLADALLERALAHRIGGAPLRPLDDHLEDMSHERALKLPR